MSEKLVRDFIPQVIAAKGEQVPPWRIVSPGPERLTLLLAKLDEEVAELKEVAEKVRPLLGRLDYDEEEFRRLGTKLAEEAADVLEALLGIVQKDTLEDSYWRKRRERGGFQLGVAMKFPDR